MRIQFAFLLVSAAAMLAVRAAPTQTEMQLRDVHASTSTLSPLRRQAVDDGEDDGADDENDDGSNSSSSPSDIHARSSKRSSRITFYSGRQLQNPACGGPSPGKNAMVAAVSEGGQYECGDQIMIAHNNKQIKVKVVDYCPGCDDSAIDLSPGAFSRLASLSKGIIQAKTWLSN